MQNNGKTFDKIKTTDRENFWKNLLRIIKTNYVLKNNNENFNIVKASLELLLTVFRNSQINFENEKCLVEIMKYLNSQNLLNDETTLSNSIIKLNEFIMSKVHWNLGIPELEYQTLQYLLNLCTSEKILVSIIYYFNFFDACIDVWLLLLLLFSFLVNIVISCQI